MCVKGCRNSGFGMCGKQGVFLEYSASECIYRAMELDLDTIEAKRILTEDDGVSPQFNITREYIYCNFFPFMNGKENSIYYRYVQGEKEAELFVEGDEENLTQRMIPDERYYYMQDLFWKMERMPEDGYKLQVFDAEEKKK